MNRRVKLNAAVERAMRTTLHVEKGLNGGWRIRKDGASIAMKVFDDKESAVGHAVLSASKIVVHKPNGRVLKVICDG